MSSRIFLLLAILLALLQGPLFPLSFAEGLLLIFYLWSNNFDKNLVWPFAAGLIFDLIQDQHLGITSLIFLIVALGLRNMRGNVPLQRPTVLAAIIAVLYILRAYLLVGSISLLILIILSFMSYFVFLIVWGGGRKEIRIG
jgi:hypothetical protein